MWLNFLHIYQPPTQEKKILADVVSGYRQLFDFMLANPEAKVLLNISGCLTKTLAEIAPDVIEKIKTLAEAGQIEFTGTAAYHPILPLISEKEVWRQIALNDQINKEYFGETFSPNGFFAPEAAYDSKILKILKKIGFAYAIVDEIGYCGKLDQLDYSQKYLDKNTGLKLLFAARMPSKTIAFTNPLSADDFYSIILQSAKQRQGLLITALDGETFGHHHKNGTELLAHYLKNGGKFVLPRDLKFARVEEVNFLPSSWETHQENLKSGEPFLLWLNFENKIQRNLWQITDLLTLAVNEEKNNQKAREALDVALCSCTFWWASCFPWWHPKMIKAGLALMQKAAKRGGFLLCRGCGGPI